MRATAGRDDFFTQIHKALRWGLFDIAGSLGRLDVADADAREGTLVAWRRLSALLHAHTWHEETFIHPLLEAKAPGSSHLRHLEHEVTEGELSRLDEAMETLDPSQGLPTPAGGPAALTSEDLNDLGRDLTAFIGAYLPHLLEEELNSMPLLWATCSDDELASCRNAFMASVGTEENELTLELFFHALDNDELAAVVEGCRAAGGIPWEQLCRVAGRLADAGRREALGIP